MISDVLADALDEIERYQKAFPNAYDEVKNELENVKVVMNAMRSYLDLPPADGRYPRFDGAKRQLRNEIAVLNVVGLSAALENVTVSWPTPDETAT